MIAASIGFPHPQGQWALLLAGQDLIGPRGQDAGDEFWFNRRRQMNAAAAQLVAARDPFLTTAMRIQARRTVVWFEPEGERVPALDPDWLAGVRDDTAFADLRPRSPEDLEKIRQRPGYGEYLAYSQALVAAARTPAETFATAARDHDHIKFAHLYNEPHKYRGKVIHIDGTLQRLNKFDAPIPAAEQGVRQRYEGWVFLKESGLPPVCVVFTDLPEGLKLGDDLQVRVAFDGYFFKKYRYQAGDMARSTLLFIAPTLKLRPGPATGSAPSGLSNSLLMGLIGCLVLTIALIVGVNLWYRKADRGVRARMTAVQASNLASDQDFIPREAADTDRQAEKKDSEPGAPPRERNGL